MTDQPLRSKSSLFFERYARAEKQNVALGLTVYLLGALSVTLAAGLIYVAARPKAVHYVPALAAGGVSYPGRVPLSSVISFSTAWLLNWSNYSPETAASVFKRSCVFMAPPLLSKVRAGLDEEVQKIARERLSSVFNLAEEPRAEEGPAGFRVVFSGERVIYVGKEEMAREATRFRLDVRRVAPTEVNPYGLAIFDIRKEKVAHDDV